MYKCVYLWMLIVFAGMAPPFYNGGWYNQWLLHAKWHTTTTIAAETLSPSTANARSIVCMCCALLCNALKCIPLCEKGLKYADATIAIARNIHALIFNFYLCMCSAQKIWKKCFTNTSASLSLLLSVCVYVCALNSGKFLMFSSRVLCHMPTCWVQNTQSG